MAKPIFEEEGQAPAAGMATAQQQIEKKARQLAYDTRYQVKKEIGGKKVDPASMKRLLLQRLQKSTAAPNVKLRAKQMLLGEEYVADSKNLAAESVASAMFKVFVEGVQKDEVIELNYIKELDETKERKYKVRVTDKKTRNSYVRYATREKISELRANPNILSVEITEYGEPREGERKSGEQTARAKAGKDWDGDGKKESPAKEYRGVVHNAIQRKQGKTPDGQDTSSVKEEFINDAATEDSNSKQIKGLKPGQKNNVVVFPNDSTTARQTDPKAVYSHTELEGDLISETGYQKFLGMLQEKAESEQQQKLFGLALSVKRGETPRSEVSDEVLKIVDTMSEKKIRDFAKTKHEGLPKKKVAEEKECGCDDEPKMKDRESDMEDMRGVKTKMNLVKNKLRAMGLKMSYEPEGEKIDEVAGLLLKGALAAGGGALAAKGLQHLQKKANQALDNASNNPNRRLMTGGTVGDLNKAIDKSRGLSNSYEPEGDLLDERRREEKGTPRPPEPSAAFKLVSKSMGAGRMGVQPRGQTRLQRQEAERITNPETGKKERERPASAGPTPAKKVSIRRKLRQTARELEQDTSGT